MVRKSLSVANWHQGWVAMSGMKICHHSIHDQLSVALSPQWCNLHQNFAHYTAISMQEEEDS